MKRGKRLDYRNGDYKHDTLVMNSMGRIGIIEVKNGETYVLYQDSKNPVLVTPYFLRHFTLYNAVYEA